MNVANALLSLFVLLPCLRSAPGESRLGDRDTTLQTAPLLLGSGAAESSNAPPRTFYVDSENGRDRNDGLSADHAWQSLERVNLAELKAGDTVRFKRRGLWRGSLRPASGTEGAPLTYTSYGEGAKPLILGSRPRSRPEDWVQVQDDVWATRPMEYRKGESVLDLRRSAWRHHQEAGDPAHGDYRLAPPQPRAHDTSGPWPPRCRIVMEVSTCSAMVFDDPESDPRTRGRRTMNGAALACSLVILPQRLLSRTAPRRTFSVGAAAAIVEEVCLPETM